MHHYECVAPNIDINLQSGRFWATSIASFRERFIDFRSCCVVFIHDHSVRYKCSYLWYDTLYMIYDMIWYDMIWYVHVCVSISVRSEHVSSFLWLCQYLHISTYQCIVLCDMIMIWYDMIWYDMIWYDMICTRVFISVRSQHVSSFLWLCQYLHITACQWIVCYRRQRHHVGRGKWFTHQPFFICCIVGGEYNLLK